MPSREDLVAALSMGPAPQQAVDGRWQRMVEELARRAAFDPRQFAAGGQEMPLAQGVTDPNAKFQGGGASGSWAPEAEPPKNWKEWWEQSTAFRPAVETAEAATGAPMEVYRGELDPTSDEAIERMADLAGMAGTGGLTTAGMKPAGALGIFGGRLAKTADLDALARAEKMAAEGATANDIWNTTGWYKGADDKWRFEIDDSKASIIEPVGMPGSEPRPLGESVLHEKAYEAYPDLAEIHSSIEMGNYDSGGAYGPTEDYPEAIYASRTDPFSLMGTTLHEMQHAVQAREGFARGGNPSEMMDEALAARRQWEDEIIPRANQTLEEEHKAWKAWLSVHAPGSDTYITSEIMPLRKQFDKEFPEWAKARKEALDIVSANPPTSQDMYLNLAGEVESRNVSDRARWAEKFRKADPPWATQEVPFEQQIVRFRK